MARRAHSAHLNAHARHNAAATFILVVIQGVIAPTCDGDDQSLGAVKSFNYEIVGNVSDEFRNRVEQAWTNLPTAFRRRILESGWKIRLAPSVVDAVPQLDGAPPRGWPAGSTWNNTDAVHLSDLRILVFAERRRTRDGRILKTNRVAGVLNHEVGHAFDLACYTGERVSSSVRFRNAYQRDVKSLENDLAEKLDYYLQDADVGRQEAFAEAFALAVGGGSDVDLQRDFRTAFPTVIETVRLFIADLPE